MAVRTPLYWDGTSLKEMSAAMITDCVDEMIRQYGRNPSVTLSRVSSAGSLNSMDDTRLRSGQAATSVSANPPESTTGEPETVTVTYDHIEQTKATVSTPTDTNNKAFPVYYDNVTGSIQAMSLQDMLDTFADPAIDRLVTDGYTGSVGDHDGMFFIGSNGTVTNETLVNASSVFNDTRADTSSFLASNIGTAGTTQDFPTTINSYYLRRFEEADNTDIGPTTPMQINSSNDLQAYTEANFSSVLQDIIRHATVNVTGMRINYEIVTSLTGTQMGSSMINTKLNGSGNYQTRFVNADDYRAQEFPDGSPTTQATYYLEASVS